MNGPQWVALLVLGLLVGPFFVYLIRQLPNGFWFEFFLAAVGLVVVGGIALLLFGSISTLWTG